MIASDPYSDNDRLRVNITDEVSPRNINMNLLTSKYDEFFKPLIRNDIILTYLLINFIIPLFKENYY